MLLRLLMELFVPAGRRLDARTKNILRAAEELATGGHVAGALEKCQAVSPRFAPHPEVRAAKARYLVRHGLAMRAGGETGRAKASFEAALEQSPGLIAAVEPLCELLLEEQSYSQAADLLDVLVGAFPGHGRYVRLLGFIRYKHEYRPVEADRLFDLAEALGESEAQFWNERGECARDLGDSLRARRYFGKALGMEPTSPIYAFNQALLGLMLEEYADAWAGYEARFGGSNQAIIELPAKRWDGTPAADCHLLVLGEQGIGDEIMFASCLAELASTMRITVSCADKLVDIFRASFPDASCIAHGDFSAVDVTQPVCAIAAGSLPGLLRTSREAFPRQAYLQAPAHSRDSVAAFVAGLPAGLRVGISWRGGTEASRLRMRSLPLAEMAKLLEIDGIVWVNLQYGDCAADLQALQALSGRVVHHSSAILADYGTTAALVEGLDLVISVCTAIVHLAGALGKEVWVLAPKVPEWRYGLNFRFMPWYRQVEVLRQDELGIWDKPLAVVRERLEERLEGRQSPSSG